MAGLNVMFTWSHHVVPHTRRRSLSSAGASRHSRSDSVRSRADTRLATSTRALDLATLAAPGNCMVVHQQSIATSTIEKLNFWCYQVLCDDNVLVLVKPGPCLTSSAPSIPLSPRCFQRHRRSSKPSTVSRAEVGQREQVQVLLAGRQVAAGEGEEVVVDWEGGSRGSLVPHQPRMAATLAICWARPFQLRHQAQPCAPPSSPVPLAMRCGSRGGVGLL